MKGFHKSLCLLLCLTGLLSGCAEVRGRHRARVGNQLYSQGNYRAALEQYRHAEELVPNLPPLVLNRGLACRQLMLPGAKSPENERMVECALSAFKKLGTLRPEDPRGEQLLVQTLFDAERYATLAALYESQLRVRPDDPAALNGLIQVYSRWDRFQDALALMMRRANSAARDAEAQYSVGVFIWNRLFQKGGNGERATFDPRAEPKQAPPAFGADDVTGQERVRLADLGIVHLERALAIQPTYAAAMTYLNLLYRQKALAYFEDPAAFQACIEAAERFRQKSVATHPGPSPQHP